MVIFNLQIILDEDMQNLYSHFKADSSFFDTEYIKEELENIILPFNDSLIDLIFNKIDEEKKRK